MERIKQAIEKVKLQSSNRTRPLDQSDQDVQNISSETRTILNDDGLENFNYVITRILKLDTDLLEKNRIIAFNKNNAMSMNFDLLRTQVLQKMKENGWRSLAITSPTPEAGKTVVAINLAMSISQQTNRTAILVDFDLRRPKIGSYLGLPLEKSLNDFLEGTAELPEVLVNPDMPRLVVLATKNPVRKSSETLSSRKIAELIKELRERYESRIVIFDLPPVLTTDDAIALIPQIDCVLLVVANGMSTKHEIDASLRHLPAKKLIGTILNKADIRKQDYYYY